MRPAKRLTGKRSIEQVPVLELDDFAGQETPAARKQVYLTTFPRPLATTSACGVRLRAPAAFTRFEPLEAFMDACQYPEYLDAKSVLQGSVVEMDMAAVFAELHKADENGATGIHVHVASLGVRNWRFLPVKRALLKRHGLASHWSCSHRGYWSAIRYLHMPSPKKTEGSLDRFPFLWARFGCHPPLSKCCNEPLTWQALVQRRDYKQKRAAEEGKTEPKVSELDVYGIIVEQGFQNTADDQTAYKKLVVHVNSHCSKAT